jgi:hypothetical protein
LINKKKKPQRSFPFLFYLLELTKLDWCHCNDFLFVSILLLGDIPFGVLVDLATLKEVWNGINFIELEFLDNVPAEDWGDKWSCLYERENERGSYVKLD